MSRKTKMTLVVALFVAVLTLAIGYAALSASLNIKGTANVSGEKWEVKFLKDEAEKTPTGKAVCNLGVIEDTSVTKLSAVFKLPGDSCTFTIPVENTGTLSASLTDVINKDLALSFEGSEDDKTILGSNVEYEVNYGNTLINGSTIFSNIDTLEPGEKETVTLKVTFKSDATSVPKASVKVKGLDRTFVFENRETTSSAATGEADDVNRKPNVPELSSGLIPVYYEQTSTTDGVWKVADKTNSGNNWYDYATQKWANAVTVKDSGYFSENSGSVSLNLKNTLNTLMSSYYTDGNNESPLVIQIQTSSSGTISFDYVMSNGGSLEIKFDGKTTTVSTSDVVGHFSQKLEPNTNYMLEVRRKGDNPGNQPASIFNLQLPSVLINIAYPNSGMDWQPTNGYMTEEKTPNPLVIIFTTGNNGGTLSFDYAISNGGNLNITLNNKKVVDTTSNDVIGHFSQQLNQNMSYTLVATRSGNNDGNQLGSIFNFSLPDNLTNEPNYANISMDWIKSNDKTYEYYVASKYYFDAINGKYTLHNFDNHEFTSNDVGKYICLDGSNSCDENELYQIQKVENGTITSALKFKSVYQTGVRDKYETAKKGTTIPMNIINTMWVWIPRYSYTIKKETGSTDYFGKGSFGNTTPTRVLPGEIDVKFVSKNTTDKGKAQYDDSTPTKEWRTNEAFNFGGTSHAGIWVGKFETTGSLDKDTQACTNTKCDTRNVTILPNEDSIVNQSVSSFFYMARSMQKNNADTFGISATKGDLHMMKNDEWGSVAYLSQSKYGKYGNTMYTGANKEIYSNDADITGSSIGKPNGGSSKYEYNNMTNLGTGKGLAGPGASTTGTIYGVYDMSGGNREYVMGVAEYDEQGNNEHNGQLETYDSGFIGLNESGESVGTYPMPEGKYYNKYKNGSVVTYEHVDTINWQRYKVETACNGGVCYGHGLSEIKSPDDTDMKKNDYSAFLIGWYDDAIGLVRRDLPWFAKGHYATNDLAGIFCTDAGTRKAEYYTTTRLSLIL